MSDDPGYSNVEVGRRALVRIVFDASALLYQQMGIASYVRHLLGSLGRMDLPDEFLLLLNDFRGDHGRVAGDLPSSPRFRRKATRLPSKLWRWLFLDRRLPVDLLTGPADVLHFPDSVAPSPVRGKTVITVHEMLDFVMPELFPTRLRDPWFARHYRQRQRYVTQSVARADHLIAVSENTRAAVLRRFALPEELVTTIPLGVNAHFRPVQSGAERAATLARYGVLEDGFLLYVGRLEDRKNCTRLFQALRQLLDRGVDVPPLVVCGWQGHPAEVADALDAIDRLRLKGAVQLIDYVPTHDLPHFYSAAAAFLFPSVYEGFGLPPLEAMACGTPVVASNAASLPEVTGDAALTVNPYDVDALAAAVERVLSDSALRRELRERGLARAAAFSWDRTAIATLQVYRRMA